MTPEDRVRLESALEQFKVATRQLRDVWCNGDYDGDELGDSYPECLPSFDEFVHEVEGMQLQPEPQTIARPVSLLRVGMLVLPHTEKEITWAGRRQRWTRDSGRVARVTALGTGADGLVRLRAVPTDELITTTYGELDEVVR